MPSRLSFLREQGNRATTGRGLKKQIIVDLGNLKLSNNYLFPFELKYVGNAWMQNKKYEYIFEIFWTIPMKNIDIDMVVPTDLFML